RRTLVVAEKRAAVERVHERLAAVGLGDLLLDLPDAGGDRSRVARDVAASIDRAGRVPRPDPQPAPAALAALRTELDAHAAGLHERREPWGVSAYEAQDALAALTDRRPAPRSRVRVRGAALEALDRARRDAVRDQLQTSAAMGALRAGPAD